jgi:AAA domain
LLHMLLDVRRRNGVAVLVSDEAQLLTAELLEEIQVLLSLRAGQERLVQIILCGQREIEERIDRIEACGLEPLATIRCKTACLTPEETHDYMQHRLKVAGAKSTSIFAPGVSEAVHLHSKGIPRVVNLLCAHALSIAAFNRIPLVSRDMIEEAAADIVFPERKPELLLVGGPRSNSLATMEVDTLLSGLPGAAPRPLPPPLPILIPKPAPVPKAPATPSASSGSPRLVKRAKLLSAIREWANRPWPRLNLCLQNHWKRLAHMTLAGALLLGLAQGTRVAEPGWNMICVVLGFMGLLLLDVSLGLGVYFFLYERLNRPGAGTGIGTPRAPVSAAQILSPVLSFLAALWKKVPG